MEFSFLLVQTRQWHLMNMNGVLRMYIFYIVAYNLNAHDQLNQTLS